MTGSTLCFLFSHDETLIERTANMVIHIEQIIRKTKARYTVAKLPYRRYVEERLHKFEIQKQRALSDRREKKIRDEKYQKSYAECTRCIKKLYQTSTVCCQKLKGQNAYG